jgi:hypothetical protein
MSTDTKNTSLVKASDNQVMAIEQALADCAAHNLTGLSPIIITLKLAKGMDTLRKNLSGELLDSVIAISNTELGFLTDRKPGQKDKDGRELSYHTWQIRDCVIDAMLRGASIVGNEFNVIAGKCYLTKNYFKRVLRDWPGLTDFKTTPGVPTQSVNGCLVPYRGEWRLNGVPDELRCEHTSEGDFRIPVKVNEGMGVDAVLGKAERKFLARVHNRVSGSGWASMQGQDDEDVLEVESTPEATGAK